MSSSKLIIKNVAQKVMANYGLHRCHDLEDFEVGFFFIFYEYTITLRAALQKIIEKINLM